VLKRVLGVSDVLLDEVVVGVAFGIDTEEADRITAGIASG
jgi:hypothetical protein